LSFRRIPIRGLPSGRDAMRMMQKMGMNVKEIEGVQEVLIKTDDKTILIEKPNVTLIKMQDQNMFQIAGGLVKETQERAPAAEISAEDVKLVMEQTGKSAEEAMKALQESEGDLAKAILKLKGEAS